MKILINVATSEKGIILYNDRSICDRKCWTESGAELKWVLPSLHGLFQKNDIKIEKDIEKIILIIGPGSFTGIRIAVSIVNTLKYLYPQIALAVLSTGELLSALDREMHEGYLFQVFASDVFEFDKTGGYIGRKDMDAVTQSEIEKNAGMLMDQLLEKFSAFETLPDTSTWEFDTLAFIENKATVLAGLAEPFYGKGANITVPKKP